MNRSREEFENAEKIKMNFRCRTYSNVFWYFYTVLETWSGELPLHFPSKDSWYIHYSNNRVHVRQPETISNIWVRRERIEQTWKCGLETHLANCLNSGTMTFWNSAGSITSSISSNSLRNITSFGLCVFGQYFNKPIITWNEPMKFSFLLKMYSDPTGWVRLGSFSRNCTIQ